MGWTELEIYSAIRKQFLSRVATARPTTRDGRYALQRHPENRLRGDRGSVEARQKSIEMFGLRLDWRAPPALVEHPEVTRTDEFELVDWGTLSDGMECAKNADPMKKNRRVQLALLTDIPNCEIWRCS